MSETRVVDWVNSSGNPVKLTVCIGYDETGAPKEIFCDGYKEGSDAQADTDDTCIVISQRLQQGATPEEIGKSLTYGSRASFFVQQLLEDPRDNWVKEFWALPRREVEAL